MEEYYKDRYELKMRRYRIIVLIVAILLIAIISIIIGWKVVATIGLLLFFLIGLVFGVVFLIPKLRNNYSQVLANSFYVGFLGALSSLLLFQLDLDPKIAGLNSQILASGKAGLLLFISYLVLGLLVVRFPKFFSSVTSVSKRFNDNLYRIFFRKA